MKRVVLAALLGGIAMFVWGSIGHLLTPIGEAGFRNLPGEAPVLDAIRANVPEDGMYFFPGMDERAKTAEGHAEWQRRYEAGPSGLLIVHPHGEQSINARLLLVELFSNILAAGLAAWAATHARTYARRVALVTAFGLCAWTSIEISYWNWYGFPAAYTLAQLVDQVVGFLVAGLVIAAIVRPSSAAA
jgi:hypothetical protein